MTGATGTVGQEVLRALNGQGHEVMSGRRDPSRATDPAARVDFEKGDAPDGPFDAIVLLRPPHIADPAPFRTMLERYDRSTRIVFLSVAGAERKSYLPHAKIEAVNRDMGFAHCFIRPGYFMENLTTTLSEELRRSWRIILPAGRLGLDWVSARHVGEMAAHALTAQREPKALRVTTGQTMGFDAALRVVNQAAGTHFRYAPLSVTAYVRHARRNGARWSFIAVMLLLHTLPRLKPDPVQSGDIETTLGRAPEPLDAWATRNAAPLRALHAHGPPGPNPTKISAASP